MGSSIGAAVKSEKAANERRKKQSIINEQAAFDEGVFNKQYYQDITKRSDIQHLLRQHDEKLRLADARATAKSAITGATPEQQLAQQEVNRRTYSDAVADIASNAARLRDQYLRDYQGQRSRYYAQRLGMQDELSAIEQNVSNQWANAANNAFATGGQMLGNGLDNASVNKAPKFQNPTTTIEPIKAPAVAGQTHFEQPASVSASDILDNDLRLKLGLPILTNQVNPTVAAR